MGMFEKIRNLRKQIAEAENKMRAKAIDEAAYARLARLKLVFDLCSFAKDFFTFVFVYGTMFNITFFAFAHIQISALNIFAFGFAWYVVSEEIPKVVQKIRG